MAELGCRYRELRDQPGRCHAGRRDRSTPQHCQTVTADALPLVERLRHARAGLRRIPQGEVLGRVTASDSLTVEVAGLAGLLARGDRLEVALPSGVPLIAEVVAQAHAYAEQGNKIEGWGLEAKRAGARSWAVDTRLLKLFFKRHRIKLDDWAERKIKSPAQIEKLLKAREIDLPRHYVEQGVSSGTKLSRTEKITRPTRSVPERLAELSQKLIGAVSR